MDGRGEKGTEKGSARREAVRMEVLSVGTEDDPACRSSVLHSFLIILALVVVVGVVVDVVVVDAR